MRSYLRNSYTRPQLFMSQCQSAVATTFLTFDLWSSWFQTHCKLLFAWLLWALQSGCTDRGALREMGRTHAHMHYTIYLPAEVAQDQFTGLLRSPPNYLPPNANFLFLCLLKFD